jgi:hypothetical protein
MRKGMGDGRLFNFFRTADCPSAAPPQPKTYPRTKLMARINRNSQKDQDQTSTNDPNGRENFIKRKSFALGAIGA